MERIIRDEDFRVDVGRASSGQTFVRVVHQPTGVSRQEVGLCGRGSGTVTADLCAAVVGELTGLGWSREAKSGPAKPGPTGT